MIRKISVLLLIAACSSAPKMKTLTSEDIKASYTRYTPGAGGGMGIDFTFTFSDSITDVRVTELLINDQALMGEVVSSNPLKIKADKFYPQQDPTVENPTPEPPKAPLYYAEQRRAVLTIESNGEKKTFVVKEFEENDPVLYP